MHPTYDLQYQALDLCNLWRLSKYDQYPSTKEILLEQVMKKEKVLKILFKLRNKFKFFHVSESFHL